VKRLVVVILILLATSISFALSIEYELEVGWVPRGEFGSRDSAVDSSAVNWNIQSNTFYVLLGLYILPTRWLYAGGEITTQMSCLDMSPPRFDPEMTNYRFECGLRFGSVELFYAHDCSHGVISSFAYRATSLWGLGQIDRIGLRFGTRRR
jgi:hypothetical protein